MMDRWRLTRSVGVVVLAGCAALGVSEREALAQGGNAPQNAADWPLHSLDISNSRYSRLDEITVSNAGKLRQAWSFDAPPSGNIHSMTPIVVDGVMYFNSGSKLYALDAVTGRKVWTFQMQPAFGGGKRVTRSRKPSRASRRSSAW